MLKSGMSLPQAWQNKPEVESRNEWYMQAFGELSTCRMIGFDTGPIPWSSVMEYARSENIEDTSSFLCIMRTMDSSYLKYVSEKRESK